MTAATWIILTSALLGVLLLLDHLRLARACQAATERAPTDASVGALDAESARLPALTMIRPTKGEDVEQFENFRAALAVDYPGPLETIFVFEDAEDPAHRHAVRAIEAHVASGAPGTARILFAGPPPPGRTGKINNMIVGTAEAGGEIIGFGDSDTRPSCDLLADLVSTLVADAEAGAVFAPPIAISPPRTFGDVGYAVILNAYLGASMQTFADEQRALPFLMGQCMLFRRTALDAIGGIECAEGQLVDDMFLGAEVRRAGFSNLLGRRTIDVVNHGLAFGDFYRLWRRWLFFGRGGIPLGFMLPMVWRGLSMFTALGFLVWCLAADMTTAAVAPLALLLAEGGHYLRLHRLLGGARIPARLVPMAWLPQPMAVWIAVSMLIDPTVEWRGHRYRLDAAARLRPVEAERDP